MADDEDFDKIGREKEIAISGLSSAGRRSAGGSTLSHASLISTSNSSSSCVREKTLSPAPPRRSGSKNALTVPSLSNVPSSPPRAGGSAPSPNCRGSTVRKDVMMNTLHSQPKGEEEEGEVHRQSSSSPPSRLAVPSAIQVASATPTVDVNPPDPHPPHLMRKVVSFHVDQTRRATHNAQQKVAVGEGEPVLAKHRHTNDNVDEDFNRHGHHRHYDGLGYTANGSFFDDEEEEEDDGEDEDEDDGSISGDHTHHDVRTAGGKPEEDDVVLFSAHGGGSSRAREALRGIRQMSGYFSETTDSSSSASSASSTNSAKAYEEAKSNPKRLTKDKDQHFDINDNNNNNNNNKTRPKHRETSAPAGTMEKINARHAQDVYPHTSEEANELTSLVPRKNTKVGVGVNAGDGRFDNQEDDEDAYMHDVLGGGRRVPKKKGLMGSNQIQIQPRDHGGGTSSLGGLLFGKSGGLGNAGGSLGYGTVTVATENDPLPNHQRGLSSSKLGQRSLTAERGQGRGSADYQHEDEEEMVAREESQVADNREGFGAERSSLFLREMSTCSSFVDPTDEEDTERGSGGGGEGNRGLLSRLKWWEWNKDKPERYRISEGGLYHDHRYDNISNHFYGGEGTPHQNSSPSSHKNKKHRTIVPLVNSVFTREGELRIATLGTRQSSSLLWPCSNKEWYYVIIGTSWPRLFLGCLLSWLTLGAVLSSLYYAASRYCGARTSVALAIYFNTVSLAANGGYVGEDEKMLDPVKNPTCFEMRTAIVMFASYMNILCVGFIAAVTIAKASAPASMRHRIVFSDNVVVRAKKKGPSSGTAEKGHLAPYGSGSQSTTPPRRDSSSPTRGGNNKKSDDDNNNNNQYSQNAWTNEEEVNSDENENKNEEVGKITRKEENTKENNTEKTVKKGASNDQRRGAHSPTSHSPYFVLQMRIGNMRQASDSAVLTGQLRIFLVTLGLDDAITHGSRKGQRPGAIRSRTYELAWRSSEEEHNTSQHHISNDNNAPGATGNAFREPDAAPPFSKALRLWFPAIVSVEADPRSASRGSRLLHNLMLKVNKNHIHNADTNTYKARPNAPHAPVESIFDFQLVAEYAAQDARTGGSYFVARHSYAPQDFRQGYKFSESCTYLSESSLEIVSAMAMGLGAQVQQAQLYQKYNHASVPIPQPSDPHVTTQKRLPWRQHVFSFSPRSSAEPSIIVDFGAFNATERDTAHEEIHTV